MKYTNFENMDPPTVEDFPYGPSVWQNRYGNEKMFEFIGINDNGGVMMCW